MGVDVPVGLSEEERVVRGEREELCVLEVMEDTLGDRELKEDTEGEEVGERLLEVLAVVQKDTDGLPLPLRAEEGEKEAEKVVSIDKVIRNGVEVGQGDEELLSVGTRTVREMEGEEDRVEDKVASTCDTLPCKAELPVPVIEGEGAEEVEEDKVGVSVAEELRVFPKSAREGLPLPGVAVTVGVLLPPPPPKAVGVERYAGAVSVASKGEGEEGRDSDAPPLPEKVGESEAEGDPEIEEERVRVGVVL